MKSGFYSRNVGILEICDLLGITQRTLVIPYRIIVATYWSLRQIFLDFFFTFKDGTYKLSRNVGIPLHAA
jgi:hypothetical protein